MVISHRGTVRSRTWSSPGTRPGRGRGRPLQRWLMLPVIRGIVGEQPTVTLAGGVITLTRQTSILDLFNSNYRNGDNPAKWASFRVGSALEAVIEDGDVLRVSRFGTGDFAATLFRGGDFILGLGALRRMPLADGMSIEEDPRADEVELYHLAADIRRPDTVFVWMDSSDPNIDAAIANLDHLAGERGSSHSPDAIQRKIWKCVEGYPGIYPAPFHHAITSMFRAASRRSKSGSRTWTNFRRRASRTCSSASTLVPCRRMFARAIRVQLTLASQCGAGLHAWLPGRTLPGRDCEEPPGPRCRDRRRVVSTDRSGEF